MPRHARPFSSRSSNSVWPDRSLHRAVSRSNHAAQSTSGKTAIRPLVGGHSISKELLISDAVSKSASPQKAITRACRRADESLPRPATADRGRRTQFFGELAAGGLLGILQRVDLAFRDRPGAVVLLAPVRAAGVDQQDFEAALSSAIRQYAGARLRLLGNSLGQEMVFHAMNRVDRPPNLRSSAERDDNPLSLWRRPRSALPGLEIDQGDADIRSFLPSQMSRSVGQDDLERGRDVARIEPTGEAVIRSPRRNDQAVSVAFGDQVLLRS
jgi:hypothetical protein